MLLSTNNFLLAKVKVAILTKAVDIARLTLPYGSEIWVTTTRNMARLEAAEMRFLRSVKGYTRLDKRRSEVIRKELEISGIQDVRSKRKQN